MATTASGDEFTVFKFEETGIVALCDEVASTEFRNYAKAIGVDLETGRFRQGDGIIEIVFDYLPGR